MCLSVFKFNFSSQLVLGVNVQCACARIKGSPITGRYCLFGVL